MTQRSSPRRNTPGWNARAPSLRIVRLPGEFGPILRCYGELSMNTAGTLRRELDLLEPLDHRVLTVDLSGCEFLDVDGILTLLESFKRRRQQGRSEADRGGEGKSYLCLTDEFKDWKPVASDQGQQRRRAWDHAL